MYKTSTKDLFSWMQVVQKDERDIDSFYLFLDLLGGISKAELNLLKLKSSNIINLKEDINILKKKWLHHKRSNEPIQYMCNYSYWRDLKLELTDKILIPRVETEQIIEIALNIMKDKNQSLTFADLGTGSGAISISLATINKHWKGLATDIDKDVLNIAKSNFQNISNTSNLKFFTGNWWEPLINYSGMIDLVISNPPYIPKEVYNKLPSSVKDFEPMLALCGGEDGLSHIKEIIYGAPRFLKKGGWMILENHHDQSQKVKKLMKGSGFDLIKTINDFFGIGRFTIGRYQ